jgi:hypothetical protein
LNSSWNRRVDSPPEIHVPPNLDSGSGTKADDDAPRRSFMTVAGRHLVVGLPLDHEPFLAGTPHPVCRSRQRVLRSGGDACGLVGRLRSGERQGASLLDRPGALNPPPQQTFAQDRSLSSAKCRLVPPLCALVERHNNGQSGGTNLSRESPPGRHGACTTPAANGSTFIYNAASVDHLRTGGGRVSCPRSQSRQDSSRTARGTTPNEANEWRSRLGSPGSERDRGAGGNRRPGDRYETSGQRRLTVSVALTL